GTHKMVRAANPPKGVRLTYWIKEYTAEDVKIRIEDKNGVLMKEIAGTNAPGLNRATWDLVPPDHLKLGDQNEEPFIPFHIRPGVYQVKIAMGELKAEKPMVELPRDQ